MSAWTKMIPVENADEALSEAMSDALVPHGTIENFMRVHLLRPNAMYGHWSSPALVFTTKPTAFRTGSIRVSAVSGPVIVQDPPSSLVQRAARRSDRLVRRLLSGCLQAHGLGAAGLAVIPAIEPERRSRRTEWQTIAQLSTSDP